MHGHARRGVGEPGRDGYMHEHATTGANTRPEHRPKTPVTDIWPRSGPTTAAGLGV
jgi:hypothetical protein